MDIDNYWITFGTLSVISTGHTFTTEFIQKKKPQQKTNFNEFNIITVTHLGQFILKTLVVLLIPCVGFAKQKMVKQNFLLKQPYEIGTSQETLQVVRLAS